MPMHYLEYLYGPDDVDHRFYENIIDTYRDIARVKNKTPHFEEIEEWVFKGIIKKIVRDSDLENGTNHRYQMDYYYRKEIIDNSIREFIQAYSENIKRDIRKCLMHAGLAFISSDFETERGTEEVVRNSAQVHIIDIYDRFGNRI